MTFSGLMHLLDDGPLIVGKCSWMMNVGDTKGKLLADAIIKAQVGGVSAFYRTIAMRS
jgi:hypothetical protein